VSVRRVERVDESQHVEREGQHTHV
jgi:hypothetical protein